MLSSLVNFKAYCDARGLDYSGFADDTAITAAIQVASDWLNLKIWKGQLVDEAQTDAWPRDNVYINGYLIDNTTTPMPIEYACNELVLLGQTEALFADVTGPAVKSEKVAVVEVEYQDGARQEQPEFGKVQALIRPYLLVATLGSVRR
jgi:hypothetical protein